MTTEAHASHVQQPRHRKRGVRKEQQCRRESCTQRKAHGTSYCGQLCVLMDRELDAIQVLIREAGAGQVSGQLWASVVQLNDALSEVLRKKSTLRAIRDRQASKPQTSNDTTAQAFSIPAQASTTTTSNSRKRTDDELQQRRNTAVPAERLPTPNQRALHRMLINVQSAQE